MTDYYREIELPSRGLFYDGEVPDGLVHVEPMGTKQEKMFAAGKQGSVVISRIFDDCLSCPIPHQDLILGDRIWVLINIRAVSRGSVYDFPFKCDACGKRDETSIDLLKLEIKHPPEDLTPADLPFKVTLPIQKVELGIRLLTGKDDDAVERYGQQVAKTNAAAAEEAKYVYRLARRIATVDGEKMGIQELMPFVEKIRGLDSQALQEGFDDFEVGPTLEIEPTCNHCGFRNDEVLMPIRGSFFRPKRRGASDGDYIRAAVVFDENA